MEELKTEVENLKNQLNIYRQKASLYYVVESELQQLRSSMSSDTLALFRSPLVESSTQTDEVMSDLETDAVGVQTDVLSDSVAHRMETETLQDRIEELREKISLKEWNEKLCNEMIVRLREVIYRTDSRELGSCSDLADSKSINTSLVGIIENLFENFTERNKHNFNLFLELKEKNELISKLNSIIVSIELNFQKKLSSVESVAESRMDVISALGNQVKEAIHLTRPEESFDVDQWMNRMGLQSEIEDLRAELSKAKTNWAATRDELIRLQTKVGDGKEKEAEYPRPVDLTRERIIGEGQLQILRKIQIHRK
jgi:hypothetical protein